MVSPAAQTACPLVRMDNNKTARERESQWSLCDCGATRTCSCPCGYRVHTRLDSIANKLHHLLLPALLPWIARRLLVSPAHHFETTPTFIRNGAWNLSFLSAFNPRYAVHSGASQARQAGFRPRRSYRFSRARVRAKAVIALIYAPLHHHLLPVSRGGAKYACMRAAAALLQ